MYVTSPFGDYFHREPSSFAELMQQLVSGVLFRWYIRHHLRRSAAKWYVHAPFPYVRLSFRIYRLEYWTKKLSYRWQTARRTVYNIQWRDRLTR